MSTYLISCQTRACLCDLSDLQLNNLVEIFSTLKLCRFGRYIIVGYQLKWRPLEGKDCPFVISLSEKGAGVVASLIYRLLLAGK